MSGWVHGAGNLLFQLAFIASVFAGLLTRSWFVFGLTLSIVLFSLVFGVASFAELRPIDGSGVKASRKSAAIQFALIILALVLYNFIKGSAP